MATGNSADTGESAELGLPPTNAVTQAFIVVRDSVRETNINFPAEVNNVQLQQYFRTLVIRIIFQTPSINLLELPSLIQGAIQIVKTQVEENGVQWLSNEVSAILET